MNERNKEVRARLEQDANRLSRAPGRDPNRIPKILAALGEVWMENPDLRLGQIMSNAAIVFYTEDDQALRELTKWRDYLRGRKP